MEGMLGWMPPTDRAHEMVYALEAAPIAKPGPVVVGIPWYVAFDQPEQASDRSWWIGRKADWGVVRGGHAVCLRPPATRDVLSAYLHYNQGNEGACVGFATARAATLFNRRLYSGFMQYEAAKRNDQWIGENYVGSSVNGGLQGLRLEGAWPMRAGKAYGPRLADGIVQFRWAKSVEEVMQALGSSEGYVRILNSWGAGYPKEVRLSLEGLRRLMGENGEFGVPVDRTP